MYSPNNGFHLDPLPNIENIYWLFTWYDDKYHKYFTEDRYFLDDFKQAHVFGVAINLFKSDLSCRLQRVKTVDMFCHHLIFRVVFIRV